MTTCVGMKKYSNSWVYKGVLAPPYLWGEIMHVLTISTI